jgi:hypothetical protein
MEREVKPFSKPWKLVERDESFEVQDWASRTLSRCFGATSYTWAISLLAAVHLTTPDPADVQGCIRATPNIKCQRFSIRWTSTP